MTSSTSPAQPTADAKVELPHNAVQRLYAYSVPNSGSHDGQEFLNEIAEYLTAMQAARPIAPETNPFSGPTLSESELDEVERAMTGRSTPIAPVQDDDAEKPKLTPEELEARRQHAREALARLGKLSLGDGRR